MIALVLLDIIVYNVTPYNIPLIILGIPYLEIKYIIIYMFALAFYNPYYIFLMPLWLIIYAMNKYVFKKIKLSTMSYITITIVNYIVYYLVYTYV